MPFLSENPNGCNRQLSTQNQDLTNESILALVKATAGIATDEEKAIAFDVMLLTKPADLLINTSHEN